MKIKAIVGLLLVSVSFIAQAGLVVRNSSYMNLEVNVADNRGMTKLPSKFSSALGGSSSLSYSNTPKNLSVRTVKIDPNGKEFYGLWYPLTAYLVKLWSKKSEQSSMGVLTIKDSTSSNPLGWNIETNVQNN